MRAVEHIDAVWEVGRDLVPNGHGRGERTRERRRSQFGLAAEHRAERFLMIATVDIADLGFRHTLRSLRHRPAPATVTGLRWLDTAAAVPLASEHPPGFGGP